MVISPDIEYISYLYCRKNIKYFSLIKKDIIQDEVLQECYEIDYDYFNKYQKFPTYEVLIEIYKGNYLNKYDEKEITSKLKKINLIFNRDLEKYDEVWLEKLVQGWIKLKNLECSIYDAVFFMKQKVTLENVNDYVEKVLDILLSRNNITFDNKIGIGLYDFDLYKRKNENIISSGYRFFDKSMGGGWKPKTLTCLIGPPKRGKTLWLCNMAVNLIKQGYNVVYVTFEMSDIDILYRIVSNLLNIPIVDFYSGIDLKIVKNRFKELKVMKMKLGDLFIKEFPTSTVGANDLEVYLKNLIEIQGFKLDLVIIDYINIMKNWRNPGMESTYLKIKQISEDLRAIAQRLNVPILTASQTTRGAFNSSDIDMEDISESVGLLHTADNVFGLIQTEDQRLNNIYYCKSLCLRYSGFVNIKQKYTVLYDYMRIEELSSGSIDKVDETNPF